MAFSAFTTEQVEAALHKAALRYRQDEWAQFPGTNFRHGWDAAMGITESCLYLGVPVGDCLTGTMWTALVARLAHAEKQIAKLVAERPIIEAVARDVESEQ